MMPKTMPKTKDESGLLNRIEGYFDSFPFFKRKKDEISVFPDALTKEIIPEPKKIKSIEPSKDENKVIKDKSKTNVISKSEVKEIVTKKVQSKKEILDVLAKENKKVETEIDEDLDAPDNLFDMTNLSDVDVKIRAGLKRESEDDFTSKIFNLFDLAEMFNMKSLTIDQLTTAYYKVYTSFGRDSQKTKHQIANKIYYLVSTKTKSAKNKCIVRVNGASGTFTLLEY